MAVGGSTMSSQSFVRSLALVGLLGATGIAHAYECGVKSPRLLALGDAYYDVGPTRNDDGEVNRARPIKDQSHTILKTLDRARFRTGSGTRFECSGKKNDTSVRRSDFTLRDISVRKRTEDFILGAFEDNRESRTVKPRSLFISLLEHEITIVNENELTAHRRQRQRNIQTGFTFFRESELNAVRNESGITLTQTLWMNGELVGTTTWQLDS